MPTHRLAATLLAGAALSLAAASPAAADSIAYLKDGQVHLATTDASRDFQVTYDGGYETVSQADDGTLLATKAGNLVRLDRYGNVLSSITTPVSTNPGGTAFTFRGPFDADVSPNGQKAAYGWFNSSATTTPDGTYVDSGNGTGFSRAGSRTSWTETGFKPSREYEYPEWVDDQRVIVSGGPGWPSDPIAVVEAGSGDSRSWFTDPENVHPKDVTESRNRRFIAAVSENRDQLHVYRDQDDLFLGAVNPCFYYSDSGSYRYSSPTFTADGSKLIWANGSGLEIAPLSKMDSGCEDGQNSTKVLPGGSNPDWGPADVPTSRPTPAPGQQPSPSPAPSQPAPTTAPKPGSTSTTQQPGGPSTQSGSGSVELQASRTTLRKALAHGLTITVDAPAAGRVALVGRAAGRKVAQGTATARSAGATKVKLVFAKKAARKLRRKRSVTLTVTATQGSHTGTLKLKLKR